MNNPKTVEAVIMNMPAKAAKMTAVEILLADPESLQDDILETCLYILRERLREPDMSDAEHAVAAEGRPVTLAQLSSRLEEYSDATAEGLEALGQRVSQIEARVAESRGRAVKSTGYELAAETLVGAKCLTELQLAEIAGWTVTTMPGLPQPSEAPGVPSAAAAILVIWADGSVTAVHSLDETREPEP